MSVNTATDLVRRMVTAEKAATGDETVALRSISHRSGVAYWTLHNIKRGRAKTVDATIFDKLRRAYLDLCARQIAVLQHEIAITREATPNDAFDDLAAEASDLAARLADARGAHLDQRHDDRRRRHPDARLDDALTSTT